MKEITIDCSAIRSRADFHDALAQALSFPGWYGRNLDALHDLLTAIGEDTQLTLLHFSACGAIAAGFRRVLDHAQVKNPRLTVIFEENTMEEKLQTDLERQAAIEAAADAVLDENMEAFLELAK